MAWPKNRMASGNYLSKVAPDGLYARLVLDASVLESESVS